MTDTASLRKLQAYLRRRRTEMVRVLGELVRRESPSDDLAAVTRAAEFLAQEWRRRGARTRLLRPRGRGAILRVELVLGRGRPQGQILLVGHLDTVYSLGTLQRMPFAVRGGRACGPGTVDMKGGLVQGLFAVEALRELGLEPRRAVRVVGLFTCDEEVGSEAGGPVIVCEARRSRAVLVLEPSTGLHGALKTARKGVGEFVVEVEGRAAHAGVEPEKGVNAIEELARQIVRLKTFERPAEGLTLNVDIIAGGTRTNVIAERARAVVDVRVTRMSQAAWIEGRMRSLRPVDKRARLVVRGGVNRPPLERSAKVVRLYRQAAHLARALGLDLQESASGGGSDGNLTAAAGVPTLDGLGGVGAGMHSPGEFVFVRKMPERAALLAGLLLTL
ncbi:MAG: M20 family metallopeptidase [Candidatus Acidiferrales bacterium]